MTPGLNAEEERELLALLEEAALGDWERRRRRFLAAYERLPKSGGDPWGEALIKARWGGGPLTEDEFIVTHAGWTPGEWAKRNLPETRKNRPPESSQFSL